MPSPDYVRLVEHAEVIRTYGGNLAVALGNFRGLDDFADQRLELYNGFILDDLRIDLITLVILRTYALMASAPDPTDATLTGIATALKSTGLQTEVVDEARRWPFNENLMWPPERNAKRAAEKMAKFLDAVAVIDVSGLKGHRHWVLAHSTTKKPDPVMVLEARDAGLSVLVAVDLLTAFALGVDADLAGGCEARREQIFHFCTYNIRPVADDP